MLSETGNGPPAASRPEVSVIVPTRDRWRTLERMALRSALGQTGVDVEVVIVDDGSKVPASDALSVRDPRISVIRRDLSGGPAEARNLGLRQARADWVAFLDDDDAWAPEKLQAQLAAVRASDAGFAYTSALLLDARMRPIHRAEAIPVGELSSALRRGNAIPAGASNVVARRVLMLELGGFDEGFAALADWDMWLRLTRQAPAAAVSEALVAYREGTWVLQDEAQFRTEYERLVAKHDLRPDWFGFDRWIADVLSRGGHRVAASRRYLATARRHGHYRSIAVGLAALLGPRAVQRLLSEQIPSSPRWLGSYLPSR